MKILITPPTNATWKTFMTDENLEYLKTLGDVICNETDHVYSEDELCEAIKDVDIAITGWGTGCFTAKVMENANKLKLIAHTAGSVGPLVSDAVYEKGVRVVTGNDGFAESVAEGTMAYILAAQRKIPQFNRDVHQKGWGPLDYTNYSLLRRKIGIVGYGAVSKFLIEMLKPFHCDILLYSGHMSEEDAKAVGATKASLEEIFSTCSIVSLHTSATPKNAGLITKELLAMMPDDALLVNTARPAVLDEDALYDECKTGRIRAFLDVHKDEAILPMESRMRWLDDVLLMPHHAGPTIDYRKFAALYALQDVERFLKGEELHHEISHKRAATMTR